MRVILCREPQGSRGQCRCPVQSNVVGNLVCIGYHEAVLAFSAVCVVKIVTTWSYGMTNATENNEAGASLSTTSSGGRSNSTGKQGRARVYPRTSGWDCPSREIDEQLALTGELVERVVDQVNDLPLEGLSFRPAGAYFSIAKLVLHLAESERRQLSRVARALSTVTAIDSSDALYPRVNEALAHSHILSDEAVPDEFLDGAFLGEVMRSVFRTVTVPVCQAISEPDSPLGEQSSFATPREALTHMQWHWAYHSGQIGLLRLQWGDDYVWTTKQRPE